MFFEFTQFVEPYGPSESQPHEGEKEREGERERGGEVVREVTGRPTSVHFTWHTTLTSAI